MNIREAYRAVSALAASQSGLVTTKQAADLGVSRLYLSRLAESGDLERVVHGVYLVLGAPHDEHTERRAVWLALDPARTATERAVNRERIVAASHRTAATIHGIGDLPDYDYTYTSTRRIQTARDGVTVHQGALGRDDVVMSAGMFVTSVERTLVDLAASEVDLGHISDALRDAMALNAVDLESLAGRLDRAASAHDMPSGEALLVRLLTDGDLDSRQEFEYARSHVEAVLERLVDAARAPQPSLTSHGMSLIALATVRQRMGPDSFDLLGAQA